MPFRRVFIAIALIAPCLTAFPAASALGGAQPPPPADAGQPADENGVQAGEDAVATPERAAVPQEVVRRTLPNGVAAMVQPLPGVELAAVLVLFRVGANRDPANAGMARLLDRLLMTAPAEDAHEGRTVESLNSMYPDGWNAQTFPDHSVYGFVIPTKRLDDEVQRLAARLRSLRIDEGAIARELDAMEAELAERFEKRDHLVPMAWLMAKSFRHDSDPPRGIDVDDLRRLDARRVQKEWDHRVAGANVAVVIVGPVEAEPTLSSIESAFAALSGERPDERRITVRPVGGGVGREIVGVEYLPGGKSHGVMTYFAPAITDADHPAFLTIARAMTREATELPGSEARLEFQYDMLLDPRAAYVAPHVWRYPRGIQQGLGYWDAKLTNHKFSRGDVKRALGALDWQLGAPLQGALVDGIVKTPGLLYTIAYATAFRSHHGDDAFWADYRDRLSRLDAKELDAARDKYFVKSNMAVFILQAKP